MAAIHVVFARPHAVIAHLIVLRVQREQHPELRHVAQFLHRVVAQLRVHPAAGVHGVAHRALGRRGGGQRVEIGDAHAAVHLVLHLRLVHGQTVQGRQLPLTVALRHPIAVVVFRGSAPEVGHGRGFQHLHAACAVRDHLALRFAEQHAEMLAGHAQIVEAIDHADRHSETGGLLFLYPPRALTEGYLISRLGPFRSLPLTEGQGHGVLAAPGLFREGQGQGGRLAGGHVGLDLPTGDLPAIPAQRGDAPPRGGAGEQAVIADGDAVPAHVGKHALVVVLDLLHLGGLAAVAEHDAVAAEIPVGGAFAKIAAVEIRVLAVTILHADALVDEVPDEAALIQKQFIGVLGIFVHRAVGVTHGVGVFAQDEGLVPVLLQILTNLPDGRVHLAFHIGGIVIPPVVGRALVMHQPGIVQRPEALAHGVGHAAAQRLVAAAPDQNGRMILVPLVGGLDPVQHLVLPVLPVSGNGEAQGLFPRLDALPHAVGFQIGFGDHIQAQLVAQGVHRVVVGIMAGAHGVDIVPLHGEQIPADMLRRHGTAPLGAEIVAVRTLEHDALAVQAHQAVLHFKPAEAHVLADDLRHPSLAVLHRHQQPVQLRTLGAPLLRLPHGQLGHGFAVRSLNGGRSDFPLAVRQTKFHLPRALAFHLGAQLQRAVPIVVIQQSADAQIAHVNGGHSVQIHVPEQAAEAEEVLILGPAARPPAVHPAGQLVPARQQIGGQVKVAGGKAVAAEAHVPAVEPQGHAAFRSLKGYPHRHSLHAFRQLEGLHIACHRVETLGNFARLNILPAVPWVLGVAVLGNAVSLQLHVGRHGDVGPVGAVVLRLLEAGDQLLFIDGIKKLPISIQAHPQAVFPGLQIFQTGESLMVGMGGKAIFTEELRVFQLFRMKFHLWYPRFFRR